MKDNKPLRQDRPHPSNSCGGGFADWLEVNLTDQCNGRCAWCVEKRGWHPSKHASWRVIAYQAIASGKSNVILLGGEPLLYPRLKLLVAALVNADRRVWLTTNGSLLDAEFVKDNLVGVTGVNVSIHHYDLEANCDIVGIRLDRLMLMGVINVLHGQGTSVRLNCNCIKGAIDSDKTIHTYIAFAKGVGADKVRFSELKCDESNFVDLTEIVESKYGLSKNPFTEGCFRDCVIDDMPVNFRQMCGLHTSRRCKPVNPVQVSKQVLYYDGRLYDGWQVAAKGRKKMKAKKAKKLLRLLKKIASGKVAPFDAMVQITSKVASKRKKAGGYTEDGMRHCGY